MKEWLKKCIEKHHSFYNILLMDQLKKAISGNDYRQVCAKIEEAYQNLSDREKKALIAKLEYHKKEGPFDSVTREIAEVAIFISSITLLFNFINKMIGKVDAFFLDPYIYIVYIVVSLSIPILFVLIAIQLVASNLQEKRNTLIRVYLRLIENK